MSSSEGPVLDRRTLNRTLLSRQLLVDRVAMPVAAAIEHLVGMQAQVPTDPYVSLWSRLRGFDPAELEQLLLARRAVRMNVMRATLHLVTSRDALALQPVMEAVAKRGFRSTAFHRQLDGIDLNEVLAAGLRLVEERPRTTAEIGRGLAEHWPDRDRAALGYAVRYLVPNVQVPPRGLWSRSGPPRVTTLAAWLGDLRVDRAETSEVVPRYLRAFGPATVADIRTWSGLTGLAGVVEALGPRLRTYRDEAGRTLLDTTDGTIADRDLPAPVRFLGEYDNVFLAHSDRARITGDETWGPSFIRRGSFFVDGFLAGAWQLHRKPGGATMKVQPLRRLQSPALDDVAAEATRLLGFLAPEAEPGDLELAGPGV